MHTFDFQNLVKFNLSVPRYTSYPTAPQFISMEPSIYREKLHSLGKKETPLSIYIHIPFCHSMCLFCACSVVLNRNEQRQRKYLNALLREIQLVAQSLGTPKRVSQLHLGGGTPTSLSAIELTLLMDRLQEVFVFSSDAEISIEIDPRTVFADRGKKLTLLRELGFNRVSFGVQDLDPKVQEAVKRRQSEEMTVQTYEWARSLGFQGINLDFIYGLPHQSALQFGKTVERIIKLRPDRIAFFSYAHVPWLKLHQKAIAEKTLPSVEEKFRIYVEARHQFLESGYVAIGMDHFALRTDPLSLALQEKRLMRNFLGYTLKLAEDLIGFGMTAIGYVENGYFQNRKKLEEYESCIENSSFPIEKGLLLTEEDLRRRWVIDSLMCRFEVEKQEFQKRFHLDFDLHFSSEMEKLERMGLIEENTTRFVPTSIGRLMIRVVASAFDTYLSKGQFSKAI